MAGALAGGARWMCIDTVSVIWFWTHAFDRTTLLAHATAQLSHRSSCIPLSAAVFSVHCGNEEVISSSYHIAS